MGRQYQGFRLLKSVYEISPYLSAFHFTDVFSLDLRIFQAPPTALWFCSKFLRLVL